MTRIAVVGDVHGDITKLRAALHALGGADRHVVFVGDYVNGGTASAQVLDELSHLAVSDPHRYTFLAGNHDLGLLRYLADGNFGAFAAMGGVTTIHSYVSEVHGDVHAAFVRVFPQAHRTFLEGLLPCWDDGHVLVSHAGFDPTDPALRSMGALAFGDRGAPFSATSFPRELVVCGHYVQPGGRPHVSEHLICVDTGCGTFGGPLTVLLLPERRFISL